MSFILKDSTSTKGKTIYLAKGNTISTDSRDAETFANIKKAENYLKSLPKILKKYKFTIFDKDGEISSIRGEDLALINNVLGKSSGMKIPKVTRKFENFSESTRTLEDTIEISKKEVNQNISKKITCSVPTDYCESSEYIESLKNHLSSIATFISNLEDDITKKRLELSECDKKIASLNHLLEFYGEHMNACEHYKVSKETNKLVQIRRSVKNTIYIAEKLKSIINIKDSIDDVIKECINLQEPIYQVEYYQDWFQAKAENRRIV